MARLLPVSGPFSGPTTIHFGPNSSRSITINGVALPADQVKVYFDQPTAALINLPVEVKRCSTPADSARAVDVSLVHACIHA